MREPQGAIQIENTMEVEPQYDPIEEEIAKEEKQRRKKRIQKAAVVVVAAMFIFANIIFFTSSFQETKEPPQPGFNIEMLDTNIIEYQFYGEYTGNYTRGWRERIDNHGDRNGVVTEKEVEDYEEFSREGAPGKIALGIRINGSMGKYERFNLQFSGAEGATDSEKPFKYYISYRLEFILLGMDDSSFRIYILNYWDLEFDFKFKAPEGYMISNVIGLKEMEYNSDTTVVRGINDGDEFGTDVYILRMI
jgi:hypothetical protein